MGHKRKHRKQRNAALQAAAQQANTELNLPPPPEFIADVGKGESRSTGIVTIPEIEQQYRDREAQALAAQQQLVAAGDALQAKQLAFEEEQKRVATEAAAREDALAAELRAAGGREGSGAATRPPRRRARTSCRRSRPSCPRPRRSR